MRSLLICLLIANITSAQQYDVVIANGKIIDGTGNSWYYGDVAIKDGKIVYVGKMNTVSITAIKVINAKGLIIAPGLY
jgi:N-acyl-D-amino-acid deacylase